MFMFRALEGSACGVADGPIYTVSLLYCIAGVKGPSKQPQTLNPESVNLKPKPTMWLGAGRAGGLIVFSSTASLWVQRPGLGSGVERTYLYK